MTEKYPLVSIIVPVYNVERYLRTCLDSLISQTLRDIEIICVNDASPDNSLAILREYEAKDERIIIVDLKENVCLGGARDKGIEIARAEYVIFVDSDDWVSNDMCEQSYYKAKETNAEIVNFDFWRCEGEKQKYDKKYDAFIFDLKREEANRYFILSPSFAWMNLFKKDIFVNNQLFFPSHTFYEDLAIMAVIFLIAKKVVHIEKALYYYRIHDLSASHRKNDYRFYDYITGINLLLTNMKCYGFYNKYEPELEYIYTVYRHDTIILGSLLKFTTVDREQIKKAQQVMQETFPNFKSNLYFKKQHFSIKRVIIKITRWNLELGILLANICQQVNVCLKKKRA